MKKIILIASLTLYSNITFINANILDSTIKYWYSDKSTVFWNKKHLENIDFKTIYPKPLYQKSYFGYLVTGVIIVGAGAFTYFTAGAGAPVAATGTSTVAAWVAGGGAGSYMAGLSTIGGWFGGNAILGASILNGISIAVIGGGSTTFLSMSILSKIGVMASITASALDGIFYFENPDTNSLEYKVKLTIPKDLGSGTTRKLVNKLYEIDENITNAYIDKNETRQIELFNIKENIYKDANVLLQKQLQQENNQEDIMVLGIIAWNTNHIDLFDKALKKINISKIQNRGFLNYLYALHFLSKNSINIAIEYLKISIEENPYAIEPVLLYINILGNLDFLKNEPKILELAKKIDNDFDSDSYVTRYSLVSIYYRIATFYFINKKYHDAEIYYQKAYEELNIIQKYIFGKELRNTIKLSIANSVYKQGFTSTSYEIYSSILDDIDSEEGRNHITKQYLGKDR
jgi:hypothetical protein